MTNHKPTLGDSPTIKDIVNTLANPKEYVRKVLENMIACKKEHGLASVAIGKTGRGIVPNYRVSPDILSDWQGKIDPGEFFKAYNGRSHKRIEDWDVWELREEHWSDLRMSFEQVQNLLGELRGFQRKRL